MHHELHGDVQNARQHGAHRASRLVAGSDADDRTVRREQRLGLEQWRHDDPRSWRSGSHPGFGQRPRLSAPGVPRDRDGTAVVHDKSLMAHQHEQAAIAEATANRCKLAQPIPRGLITR